MEQDFLSLVRWALDQNASDLFLVAGQPPSCKAEGTMKVKEGDRLSPEEAYELISQAYDLAKRDMTTVLDQGDDDFAVSLAGLSRLRLSAYRQRGSLAVVVRLVPFGIPDFDKIGIPEDVVQAGLATQGLVLVTGSAGSGKSTTLACMLDRINHTRPGHIITLEDPIEYLHRNDKCIVSQREIHVDAADYLTALRASLRQAPDVILLGEMRDYETISTALTAAETGHLVLSTLHTRSASSTIARIIDVFPADGQQQVRVQLALTLRTVISQQLLPGIDGGLVPAFEVMQVGPAVRNLIRENKLNQLPTVLASGALGSMSMDSSLVELVKAKRIAKQTALAYTENPESLQKRL